MVHIFEPNTGTYIKRNLSITILAKTPITHFTSKFNVMKHCCMSTVSLPVCVYPSAPTSLSYFRSVPPPGVHYMHYCLRFFHFILASTVNVRTLTEVEKVSWTYPFGLHRNLLRHHCRLLVQLCSPNAVLPRTALILIPDEPEHAA